MECTIERSKQGPYYTLTVDGKFEGNYDTVAEAATEFEKIVLKERESA